MRVGRLELHSDKAFGKILEHHHICEALIDLFELFFDNTNFVIRNMRGNFGAMEVPLTAGTKSWTRWVSAQEVIEISRCSNYFLLLESRCNSCPFRIGHDLPMSGRTVGDDA